MLLTLLINNHKLRNGLYYLIFEIMIASFSLMVSGTTLTFHRR